MSNWFTERRIDWIVESITIFGFINREHIGKKFRVSTPQASADLREAQQRFPSLMIYDKRQKRYVLESSKPQEPFDD